MPKRNAKTDLELVPREFNLLWDGGLVGKLARDDARLDSTELTLLIEDLSYGFTAADCRFIADKLDELNGG